MALGKTHRRFNLLTGLVFSVLIGFLTHFDWEVLGCFVICFCLGTFILTPDIDLGPNRFAGLSKLFLYPYSLIFKHRGLSHSLLLGTLTRILYGLVVLFIVFFIADHILKSSQFVDGAWNFIHKFFFAFNYEYWPHKWLIWCYLGLFLSDLSHVILDSLSTLRKRLF